MNKVVSERPGVREGHLLRKKDNPLFPAGSREVGNDALAEARLRDGLEMDRFMERFQALVQRAVALDPNTPSETVLELKEQLDQSYQQACALPGDQSAVRNAIRKLIEVIMSSIRSGAGNDDYAARQLDEEDQARHTHFQLQELPLVAALTHPESPVGADELIPTLLSEDDASLQPSLLLFDSSQLTEICHEAGLYLQAIDPDRQLTAAWRRLGLIDEYRRQNMPPATAN